MVRRIAAGIVAVLAFAGAGCQKEEGPAERAGRALDDAAESVKDGVQDLTHEDGPFEKAGEAADDAVEKAKQAAADAMEE
jgi:hypothetical protein